MNRFGQGQMAIFRFRDKNQSFELAWEFKLPRIPHDTGYYLFEDQLCSQQYLEQNNHAERIQTSSD